MTLNPLLSFSLFAHAHVTMEISCLSGCSKLVKGIKRKVAGCEDNFKSITDKKTWKVNNGPPQLVQLFEPGSLVFLSSEAGGSYI